ncbi:2-oxoglutarate (2OG) and Fe(II)-dependent oxygenase superfamily protein [Klebsormidium nitens]|uniref:2-oxoglutarate (2OG) and Fe(II)-dependent oxygenase superfamily protein n=1 Tax=Klebsormidium nitens TaxID=105231 RepID=A0A1Y1I1X3_KLENI|nr:2-oxoglutarate (2OG) and Fe(II)-dependent oxygenase superfamily protein [Klebsormidium nitens]|eukprot:GAQ84473.1 2-oxoglutarate (2OG) and Fe(II)-dependent oxygenase superfamily protein [Klebsormidium nitens]
MGRGAMGYEQASDNADGRTAFRKAEKLYKLYTERNPKSGESGKGSRKTKQEVDLSGVIDLNRIQEDGAYAEERGAQRLESGCNRPTYILHSHPGLYLVPGAIPVCKQQYWIQQALEVFPEPPNRTNHNAEYGPVKGLWGLAQKELKSQADANTVRSVKAQAERVSGTASNGGCSRLNRRAENGVRSTELEGTGSRSLTLEAESLDPGSSCSAEPVHASSRKAGASFQNGHLDAAIEGPGTTGRAESSSKITDPMLKRRPSAAKLLRKLRWATLGLQYDWSSRSYDESLPHAPFPADLADLAARLAAPAMRHLSVQSVSNPNFVQQPLRSPDLERSEGECQTGIESGPDSESTSEGDQKSANENVRGRKDANGSEERQKTEKRSEGGWKSESGSVGERKRESRGNGDLESETGREGGQQIGEGPPGGECKAGRKSENTSDWGRKSKKGLQERESESQFAECRKEGPGREFRAEGAIVNYYGPADALSGHLDDVEENMDLPIVSISLGCKALFLIGGETRDVPPTGIFLRSGDVVLMAGPARRCYHGVPRIFTDALHSDLPPAIQRDSADTDFRPFADYIASSRININVRQVH